MEPNNLVISSTSIHDNMTLELSIKPNSQVKRVSLKDHNNSQLGRDKILEVLSDDFYEINQKSKSSLEKVLGAGTFDKGAFNTSLLMV